MQLIPNLTFNGDCREALTFYADLFDGELGTFLTWDADTVAAVPDMNEQHIMNGLVTMDGYMILGSDQFGEMYSPAGNISLMIELDDLADANAKFAALSEDGQVWMPFGETFWADGYGFCMDRFGIAWQVACGTKAQ